MKYYLMNDLVMFNRNDFHHEEEGTIKSRMVVAGQPVYSMLTSTGEVIHNIEHNRIASFLSGSEAIPPLPTT